MSKKKLIITILLCLICIPLIIILVSYIIFKSQPDVYAVTTARYGNFTRENEQNVITSMGDESTEENFRIYFQWYNVVHELGHGMLIYNSDIKISRADEEQLVNDFAVAYWKTYGEEEKVEKLRNIAAYASEHVKSSANGENYLDYGRNHWDDDDFLTFNNYGWFQFSSVTNSFNDPKSLDEVLKEMKLKGYTLPDAPEKLVYNELSEEISTEIINDAVRNINSWGLEFPEVSHHFSDDPNDNYSSPAKMVKGNEIPDVLKMNHN